MSVPPQAHGLHSIRPSNHGPHATPRADQERSSHHEMHEVRRRQLSLRQERTLLLRRRLPLQRLVADDREISRRTGAFLGGALRSFTGLTSAERAVDTSPGSSMATKKQALPERKNELVVQKLGEETLVYDQTTHRAHSLNRVASLVFEKLDGKNDVDAVVKYVNKGLERKASPEVVAAAVNDLAEADLLQPNGALPRRTLLRGLAAGLIPVVASVVVPSAVAAASCDAFGSPCTPLAYGASTCCYGYSCQNFGYGFYCGGFPPFLNLEDGSGSPDDRL